MWDLLKGEIEEFSPTKPIRATLERKKRHGGSQVIDDISWQSGQSLDFQIPPELEIPEKWQRRSRISRYIYVSGLLGLFGWKILRIWLGKTENEFMNTGIGVVLAYLVGTAIISGLSLGLICRIRMNAITRAAGFFDIEPSTSNTLKYVLLTVVVIFGLILLLI
jgi:hypothetical protein